MELKIAAGPPVNREKCPSHPLSPDQGHHCSSMEEGWLGLAVDKYLVHVAHPHTHHAKGSVLVEGWERESGFTKSPHVLYGETDRSDFA